MSGPRKISVWAPAIVAVFALLFASGPVLAWPSPAPTTAMTMTPADQSDTEAPCDPVKMTCARLCAVLCHGLVPTPAGVVPVAPPADVRHCLVAHTLTGIAPESEDPPPRA